jgi:site-specific recombinase XerD
VQPTISALAVSWKRHLLARNRSPQTIKTYLHAVESFARAFPDVEAASLTSRDIESFIGGRLEQVKPATVSVQFRALQQFWKWAFEEGETDASLMAKLRPPIVPEESPAVLTDAQIAKLFACCQGRAFAARRDMAILRLLLDTGMRRRMPMNPARSPRTASGHGSGQRSVRRSRTACGTCCSALGNSTRAA